MKLDSLDRKILRSLQEDARHSRRQMATTFGVSTPTISSRLGRLEQLGIIVGYQVKLNPEFFPASCIFEVEGPLPTLQKIIEKILSSSHEAVESWLVEGPLMFVQAIGTISELRKLKNKMREAGAEVAARRALSVPEVADALGISTRLVYDSIRRGDLPALRLGGRLLIPVAQLDAVLAGAVQGDDGSSD